MVVQSNIDYHPDNSVVENSVENKGFLNCHFCINAQTDMEHTEPDASYTVIIVPKQVVDKEDNEPSHIGRFEFNINEDTTIVIPMNPGLLMTYSGFMLTHRQQLLKKMNPLSFS